MSITYDLAITLLGLNPIEIRAHVHRDKYVNVHHSITHNDQKKKKGKKSNVYLRIENTKMKRNE